MRYKYDDLKSLIIGTPLTTHDIVIILVLTFPMFLFSIYPGIVLSNFLEKKFHIQEKQKRAVMIITAFMFSVTLSSLLYLT